MPTALSASRWLDMAGGTQQDRIEVYLLQIAACIPQLFVVFKIVEVVNVANSRASATKLRI